MFLASHACLQPLCGVCVCAGHVGCDCAHVQCWSGLPQTSYVIGTHECVGVALARIPDPHLFF